MKRLYAFLIAAALCFPSIGAMAWWQSIQQVAVSAAPTYTGPGDVVSGAKGWWGLRAYSTADRGNRLISLCDASAANCTDVASDAVTGKLVAPTNIGGTDCTSVNTCKITKFYDRSGALQCSAAACDASQATSANMATLTWNCINGLPCAVFNGTSATYSTPSITAIAQTNFFSTVVMQTGNTGVTNVFAASANLFQFRSGSLIGLFMGSATVTAAQTAGHFHSLQFVGAGASSIINVDGSASTVSPGTTSFGATAVALGSNAGANFFTGDILEFGAWSGSGNQSGMNSNQTAYWGPF